MHTKAAFVFWITLTLYIITLFTVSYVGVYLTYVALPVIILSGLIMKFTKPKPEYNEVIGSARALIIGTSETTTTALGGLNSFLTEMNNSMSDFNEITDLSQKRTEHLRKHRQQLRLKLIEISPKYENSQDIDSISKNNKARIDVESKILDIENQIATIKTACELEVKSRSLKGS
ncbi:hypothetical protein H5123_06215 [Shewanella sp. SR43-4]|uniref:hypothetical protein n=1 Tax=Shewanella sp. SR43-4 TaxID=2760942 RepID=UPI0015F8EDDF|nr:hypothetical protein [Shewanella sp. SR43-4]MBB1317229.1 hypothetical protein [Shewanella sp. SR43-4]